MTVRNQSQTDTRGTATHKAHDTRRPEEAPQSPLTKRETASTRAARHESAGHLRELHHDTNTQLPGAGGTVPELEGVSVKRKLMKRKRL